MIRASTSFVLGEHVASPRGYAEMMTEHPYARPAEPVQMALTDYRWDVLREVRHLFGKGWTYRPDGPKDEWNYRAWSAVTQTGAGDCEDAAMAMVQIARQWGETTIPDGSLRLVACRHPGVSPMLPGHCVLSVHTDQGEYILDSLAPGVWPWRTLPYTYLAVEALGEDQWRAIVKEVLLSDAAKSPVLS